MAAVSQRRGVRISSVLARVGVAVAAGLACALATPAPALGSGFAAAEFGGEHGNVVTTNPTALYFNPAGIAFGAGTRLYVSGVLALRRASWSHARATSEAPEPPGAEGADTGEARFSNLFGAPTLAATTWSPARAGRRVLRPVRRPRPLGAELTFANEPTFPLAADGVQRWHII